MRTSLFLSTIVFATGLFAGTAFADFIDPNQVDDPVWQEVMAGKLSVIPSTRPTGPGSIGLESVTVKNKVSKNNKKHRGLDRQIQLDRPYDLTKIEGLVWNQSPSSNEPISGSASVARLLQEVTANFAKTQAGQVIPVYVLALKKKRVVEPLEHFVEFGWFTFNETGEPTDVETDPVKYQDGILVKVKAKKNSTGMLTLDAARQWALVEAILKQNVVAIDRIEMPIEARVLLLNHAIKMRADQALIRRASMLITNIHPFEKRTYMRVVVGCSARDRLLGCHGISTPEEEAIVNRITNQILKDAVLADNETRRTALQRAEIACPTDTHEIMADYDRIMLRDENGEIDELSKDINRSIYRVSGCNQVVDLEDWKNRINKADDHKLQEILRAKVEYSPDMIQGIKTLLDGLNPYAQTRFISYWSHLLLVNDDPAYLNTLFDLFEKRVDKKLQRENSNKDKISSGFQMLEVVMAFIAVADVPDKKLTLEQRLEYWRNVVKNAQGKTKMQLLQEAFDRNNVQYDRKKPLDDYTNMNVYITAYVRLVESNISVAMNIHSMLSRAFHANIPVARYLRMKKEWQDIGKLSSWWKANKMLYIPNNNAAKLDYDLVSLCRDYRNVMSQIMGAEIPEDES